MQPSSQLPLNYRESSPHLQRQKFTSTSQPPPMYQFLSSEDIQLAAHRSLPLHRATHIMIVIMVGAKHKYVSQWWNTNQTMPHETCLVKIDKARPYIDAFVQYCLQFGIGQGSGEEGTMEVLYAHIYFTAHIMVRH